MVTAIEIQGLSKSYHLKSLEKERYVSLRDIISSRFSQYLQKPRPNSVKRDPVTSTSSSDLFWALTDINLNIQPGERVGIVGRNGAGKSTLLKLLSRITYPSSGTITLNGRVASLLEVGTGFHPELTGRENIFLNGAILGMSRLEILRKFDDIVDFAEVHRFLDTPVKRYSSGMYVRLAFSVAAHLDFDILIVDEVLAVGDASFQRKCLGVMESIGNSGRTVLFVSHNMGAVAELCDRGLLLDHGRLVADGPIETIITEYCRTSLAKSKSSNDQIFYPALPASLVSVDVSSNCSNEYLVFDVTDELHISIRYSVSHRLYGLQLAMTLIRNMTEIFHTFDTDNIPTSDYIDPGTYDIAHIIPPLSMKAGSYSISFTLGTPSQLIQNLQGVIQFEIEENKINLNDKGYRKDRPGCIITPGRWVRV